MDRDPDPIKNLGLHNNWLDPLSVAPLIKPEAFVLINGELPISRAAFEALPEYSTSLPTGTRPGKVWKRQSRVGWHWLDEWTLGTYGEPYPEGHEHHGSIPISWFPIRRAGQPAAFPREVRIPPPPMRGRMIDAPLGTDEGDLCLRSEGGHPPCLGVLAYEPDRLRYGSCGCSTSPMPPCSYCTSTMPECPRCGWRCEE